MSFTQGSPTVISSSDTHSAFVFVNDSTSGNANFGWVQLPAATTKGQVILLTVDNFSSSAGGINILPAGNDVVIDAYITWGSTSAKTTPSADFPLAANYNMELVSDGAGHWFITLNN
jgi:hypothetical protein